MEITARARDNSGIELALIGLIGGGREERERVIRTNNCECWIYGADGFDDSSNKPELNASFRWNVSLSCRLSSGLVSIQR